MYRNQCEEFVCGYWGSSVWWPVEAVFLELLACGPGQIIVTLNPLAPEPPVQIHILSTPRDVISFKGQGQLCPLTCAEWRDLSNHTRMSTIQSRTPEKKAKNHARLTCKSPWKSCSITHLPFLLPNPKILKAFLKTLPFKMKPTKCPAREKKWARKGKKEGRREREK